MLNKIRVRFAPSPTGYLHIGSLRTVLFGYLMAKTMKGTLILRIEDTDQKREVKGAVERLINILDWLGIKFDEGPGVIRAATNGAHTNLNMDVGEYGPYIQSQRLEIYKKYQNLLLEKEGAYYCFCSEERLEKMRQQLLKKKLPSKYDRTCRTLTSEQVQKRLSRGEKYVIRQKMPLTGKTVVRDVLRGEIIFQNSDLEDHILIKSNGIPTYQFAVVVDDYLMKISHVLRGEEWIPSFPKNILLYGSFGWHPPEFIHLPLTLNKTGGKLSKRQDDVAVEDYKANGYLAEALLNFSVLLGWHPKDEQEILSLTDMIKKFEYHNLGSSPAVFNSEKLDYFNGWYIRHKSLDELTVLCLPFLVKAKIIEKFSIFNFQFSNSSKLKNKITGEEVTLDYIKKIVALEQERLKKLSEIGELTRFFFETEPVYEPELLVWKKMTLKQIKENLNLVYELLKKIPEEDWTDDSIEEGVINYLQAKQYKLGEYLWPMRVALTGREGSPGPFEVAEVLGKEKSLKRIKEAIEKL